MIIVSNLTETHIFREQNGILEFLLLKRSPEQIYPNLWQMVSGKIQEEEKAFETAIREIKEETGLKPIKFWTVPNVNSFYSKDYDSITLVPVFAAQVEFGAEVQLSEEHTEYKWVSADAAKKDLAWEGQQKSVDIISEYFFNYKSFLDLIEIEL